MRGACAADDPWQGYRQKFRVFFREARTFEAHLQGLSLEVCQQLERLLTDVVGPIAETLCLRILPSVRDVPSAITALAAAIPDPARATAFLTAARRHFS